MYPHDIYFTLCTLKVIHGKIALAMVFGMVSLDFSLLNFIILEKTYKCSWRQLLTLSAVSYLREALRTMLFTHFCVCWSQ